MYAALTPLMSDIDVVAGVPPVERYTYVFDNTCEQVDHMFLSPALSARGAEIEHVHVNNWAASLDARLSGHDPSVAKVLVC